MSRHITLDIQSFRLSVLFCIGENLVQRIIIQMIFQFVGKIGILRRFVLRSPGEIIIFLPFGLESFAVSATHPELRFLQIDGGDSGINDSFDLCFLHIADKTLGRYDIGNQMDVCFGFPGFSGLKRGLSFFAFSFLCISSMIAG